VTGNERKWTEGLQGGRSPDSTEESSEVAPKPKMRISNERLLELAEKYPPPQNWYDEEDEFF
jgi:hypothetical protein